MVTNTGTKPVMVPRALEWSDVDSGGPEQNYKIAKVVFQLGTKQSFTNLTPMLNLYSVEPKPSTQLTLNPGDSVRILGTLSLPPAESHPNWSGAATLTAHFCVSSIRIASPAGPTHKNSSENRMLWCVTARPTYDVKLSQK